jgi:hypothetical protein
MFDPARRHLVHSTAVVSKDNTCRRSESPQLIGTARTEFIRRFAHNRSNVLGTGSTATNAPRPRQDAVDTDVRSKIAKAIPGPQKVQHKKHVLEVVAVGT